MNASRRGITGVDKELFKQLFQEARKEVFTHRLCRCAFRSTGIYPYNPEAVLKNLPELKPGENCISNNELISAMSSAATTSPPSASTASPTPQTPPPNRYCRLPPFIMRSE